MMSIANLIIAAIILLLAVVVVALATIAVRASSKGRSSSTNLKTPFKLILLVSTVLMMLYHKAILNWFATDELVSNLGTLLNPVFWTGAIVGVSTLLTFLSSGTALKGVLSAGGTNMKKIILPALAIGLALVFFMFWTEIRDGFAAWFAGSDANAQIGLEEDAISAWFWLIVPVLAWIGWIFFGPKKTKGPFKGPGFGDITMIAVGLAVIIPFLYVVLIVVAGVGDWISGGRVQNMIDQTAGIPITREDPGCNLQEYIRANGMVVPPQGAIVTICPGDGLVWLAAAPRMELLVTIDQNFRRENEAVLSTRHLMDFLYYERGGGVRDGYSFSVNDQGFTSSGLDSMKLFIRSIPQ